MPPFNLQQLFLIAAERSASDLHLTSDQVPLARIDGELRPLMTERSAEHEAERCIRSGASAGIHASRNSETLSAKELSEGLRALVSPVQWEELLRARSLDIALESSCCPDHRLRMNISFVQGQPVAAIRFLPRKISAFSSLGLPKKLLQFCKSRRGLLLVCGPSGSGKSTTLAALIEEINLSEALHVVSLEDPVEYVHTSRCALIHQREIGSDCPNFLSGIRAALRSDIDVLIIGEMRDSETISAALTAAETGHLVMATLHTQDAPQSVDRIIDSFVPTQQGQIRSQLSQCLLGICCQRLVPKINGGRCAAVELLVNNSAVANSIREGRTELIKSLIQTGARDGMQSFDVALTQLVIDGKITTTTAFENASSPSDLKRLLENRGAAR